MQKLDEIVLDSQILLGYIIICNRNCIIITVLNKLSPGAHVLAHVFAFFVIVPAGIKAVNQCAKTALARASRRKSLRTELSSPCSQCPSRPSRAFGEMLFY